LSHLTYESLEKEEHDRAHRNKNPLMRAIDKKITSDLASAIRHQRQEEKVKKDEEVIKEDV